jgi:tRNA (cytidine/uridine-2'-O-)-methyltransferase
MPLALALYQPEIPHNTGALMRLCACLGTELHLIEPFGFRLDDKALRRAGMDYRDQAVLVRHVSFAAFDAARRAAGRRLIACETTGVTAHHAFGYRPDDLILMGRESAGMPSEVIDQCDFLVNIPMRAGVRSLNLALASALVVGEALRQTGGYPAA